MSALRDQRRQIISAAVDQLLDHLDEDEDYQLDTAQLGVVAIVCEIEYPDADDANEMRTGVTYWCSDDRRFVQHGLLHVAATEAIG